MLEEAVKGKGENDRDGDAGLDTTMKDGESKKKTMFKGKAVPLHSTREMWNMMSSIFSS